MIKLGEKLNYREINESIDEKPSIGIDLSIDNVDNCD